MSATLRRPALARVGRARVSAPRWQPGRVGGRLVEDEAEDGRAASTEDERDDEDPGDEPLTTLALLAPLGQFPVFT